MCITLVLRCISVWGLYFLVYLVELTGGINFSATETLYIVCQKISSHHLMLAVLLAFRPPLWVSLELNVDAVVVQYQGQAGP